MKHIITAVLLVAASTWVACTPDKKTEETEIAEEVAAAEEDTSGTTAVTDTTLTENKKELIQNLAQHNMLQIELGKLASTKGSNNDIKQHGQQLAKMYTTKQTELQEMAKSYNLTLNNSLEEDHRKHVDELNKEKAADFDTKYLEAITDAQKNTLGEYEDVLKDITEADATAFGLWARNSEKELRAQYEQTLRQQQQLKNQ